jgi:zinc/manganese transport system substrate-binding protein
MRSMAALLALSLATSIATAGCGNDRGSGSADGRKVEVVATTTQVANLVHNVGRERVDVHQILQPNSDPHGYEPRPSDAKAVADARAIFRSGGDVDDWMGDVIDNAGGDAPQLTLIDGLATRRLEDEADPHWWQNPRNAERAVRAIRDELVKVDPDGRASYERAARRYLGRLVRLDRQTAACIGRLPVTRRKLVTSHDALGYYADRYGLEVIGAVIPSLSSQAQPSAKDVQRLVDQIRSTGVKAIFPESSINPKLERAVARESGAETGSPLWTDSLGPSGSSGATYLDSIAFNTAAIVKGLSGGTIVCRPST